MKRIIFILSSTSSGEKVLKELVRKKSKIEYLEGNLDDIKKRMLESTSNLIFVSVKLKVDAEILSPYSSRVPVLMLLKDKILLKGITLDEEKQEQEEKLSNLNMVKRFFKKNLISYFEFTPKIKRPPFATWVISVHPDKKITEESFEERIESFIRMNHDRAVA